mgnify:CR=1 FL=1
MVKNFKGKENVNSFHKIQACCPACNAFADKIEYQNSDAGNRIYCSGCGLVYNDADAGKAEQTTGPAGGYGLFRKMPSAQWEEVSAVSNSHFQAGTTSMTMSLHSRTASSLLVIRRHLISGIKFLSLV